MYLRMMGAQANFAYVFRMKVAQSSFAHFCSRMKGAQANFAYVFEYEGRPGKLCICVRL